MHYFLKNKNKIGGKNIKILNDEQNIKILNKNGLDLT